MKNYIGKKESMATLVFFSLPIVVFEYSTKSLENSGSGSCINFILCFLVSFALLYLIKNSFENLQASSVFNKIVSLVFCLYILFLGFNNYSICLSSLLSVTSNAGIDGEFLSLFIILISLLCSLCGIEALTRCTFVSYWVFLSVIFVMCLLSIFGWDYDNIAPVFGNDTKTTFLNFGGIKTFAPIMSLYFFKNHLRNKADGVAVSKSALLKIFGIGFFIIVVCILSVPYPMGMLYNFSLEGIFSTAKSGLFFHRFEIVLVFGVSLIAVVTTALGILVSSGAISYFTGFEDAKAFSFIIAFLFYITNLNFDFKMPFELLSVLLYMLLLIKSFMNYKKKKGEKI